MVRSSKNVLATLAVACVVVFPAAHAAAGMKVEPGKWTIHSVSKMSMMPAPREETRTECISEKEMRPDQFGQDQEGCQLSDIVSEKHRMAWKLVCDTGGGRMTGDAEFHSTGSTMKGRMSMSMNHGGMSMTMERSFDGRRIGDCD